MTAAQKGKPIPRIYCAGPLFNRAEQEEMAEIARTLAGAGFSVFLPHRDGFVFADVHREFLRFSAQFSSTKETNNGDSA